VSHQSRSLSAAAVESTTNIADTVNERRQRRPIERERKGIAAVRMVSPRAQSSSNQAISGTGGSRPWMKPRCAGSHVVKAQDSSTQTPSSKDARGRTEVKAACTESQTRDSIPEAIVVQPRPIHTDPANSALPNRSHLERIADLLDNFPTKVCAELTYRILTTASTLPARQSLPKVVLKIIVLFLPEYDSAA
jgi:hypothetical protein